MLDSFTRILNLPPSLKKRPVFIDGRRKSVPSFKPQSNIYGQRTPLSRCSSQIAINCCRVGSYARTNSDPRYVCREGAKRPSHQTDLSSDDSGRKRLCMDEEINRRSREKVICSVKRLDVHCGAQSIIDVYSSPKRSVKIPVGESGAKQSGVQGSGVEVIDSGCNLEDDARKQIIPTRPGFRNVGNTCYISSILAALCSVIPFVERLKTFGLVIENDYQFLVIFIIHEIGFSLMIKLITSIS